MRLRRALVIALVSVAGCQDKKPDGAPAAPPAENTGVAAATAGPATRTPPPDKGPALDGSLEGHVFRPTEISVEGLKEGPLLILRKKETDGDSNVQMLLPVPDGEKLAGRDWTFGQKEADPPITISRPNQKEATIVFAPDYTMTLRFTNQARDTVNGVIDLVVKKPADTWIKGEFRATYRKSPTAPLGPEDAPYVQGRIVVKGAKKVEKLGAGYVGVGADGKPYSNEAAFPIDVGEPVYIPIPSSEKPSQLTWLASTGDGITYRHLNVPPGDYLVYLRHDTVMSAWKRIKLKDGDQQTIDLTIDPATTGEVVVTFPESAATDPAEMSLSLVPAKADLPELGLGSEHYFNVATVKKGDKTVKVSGIPAGKYRAVLGTNEAEVEVLAGKSAAVTLGPAKK
jgi:hypothetical protein